MAKAESAFSYSDKSPISSPFRSAFTYSNTFKPPLVFEEHSKGNFREESWSAKTFRLIVTYFCYILIITLFPVSFWICVKRIHALERLVVLRFGKLRPLLGPGYCIIIPFVDNWTVVDLQPKLFCIEAQQLLTADRAIVEVSATVKYCVCNAVQYVTRLCNQDHPFQNFAQHCLLNIITEKQQSDLEGNREHVSFSIKGELNQTVLSWGLEVLNVDIPTIKVLQEAEPVHGANAVVNALKAFATQCSQSVSGSSSLSVHHTPLSDAKRKTDLFPTDNGDISKRQDLTRRISEWLEREGHKNSLNMISESFELRIAGKQNGAVCALFKDGTVSLAENSESPSTRVVIAIKEEDIEDLITGKTSPAQAYVEGKIQITKK